MTDEEKGKERQKQRERREKMSEEKRNLNRNKDRLRKQKKKEELKKKREKERKKEKERSKEEKDYDRIDTLLRMRKYRQYKCTDGCGFDGKLHLLHNLIAKQRMRFKRKYGYKTDFMRRAARNKDEEMLWQMFWTNGQKYKDLLMKKKPEFAKLFEEKKENEKKKQEERDRIEKELDEKGQWKYNNCDGEFYWSIPDENGHTISLEQFNEECARTGYSCDATIEGPSWPKHMEDECEKNYQNQLDEWEKQERELQRQEVNKYQKERRKKKKEQLTRPIEMPDLGEKGDYEKARDENILERHRAMQESGMFSDNELKYMLEKIM